MPRYEFTYYLVSKVAARVNAPNEEEASELFEASVGGYEDECGVTEVVVEEGDRRFIRGPKEVFELPPHDYGEGYPDKIGLKGLMLGATK